MNFSGKEGLPNIQKIFCSMQNASCITESDFRTNLVVVDLILISNYSLLVQSGLNTARGLLGSGMIIGYSNS